MFGKYLRAVLEVGAAVLIGAVLAFIVPYLLPFLGPDDGMLYQAFSGLADNAVFIMLIAIGAGLLARAVTESNAGVR